MQHKLLIFLMQTEEKPRNQPIGIEPGCFPKCLLSCRNDAAALSWRQTCQRSSTVRVVGLWGQLKRWAVSCGEPLPSGHSSVMVGSSLVL
ncbi:hypothetical protein M8J77_020420 [Diaphorina citri]|nr:hypothetical protein M8J77_020420 [Diaphorina citri]